MEPVYAAFMSQGAEALAKDPKAMGIGERLFINNCAACHGSDGRGSKGFPNLTDGDWLYGGSFEKVKETITAGRNGNMPPMAAAVGTADDVRNVANYVLSLSGSPHNAAAATAGQAKFAACAACHGADGKGNPAIGAANLTDKVWLYGGSVATISETINGGRNNTMPSFKNILTGPEIHLAAAYVWSLSNSGKAAAPPAAEPAKK